MTKCKFCGKRFSSTTALEQHRKVKHGTKKSRSIIKLRKKYKSYIIYVILSISVLGIIFLIYSSVVSPGLYDDFANCLTEEGFIMGGTDSCSYCKKQKALFGKSFEYINYKNCHIDSSWCLNNNIKNYPTWILPNGTKHEGILQLTTLSQLSSGCEL